MLAIALVCLSENATALDPTRLPSQFVRQQWIVGSTFPGGAVTAIAQTADGYLWIGTDKGLVRFDGFTFTNISFTPVPTASSIPILQLLTDANGELWIRPQGADVVHQRNGQFESARYGAQEMTSQITALSRDVKGRMLVSDIAHGTFRFSGGEVEKLAAPAILPGAAPIISMAEGTDGKIWMGTLGAGLFFFADGRATNINAGLPDRKINCLLPIGNDELWVGTDTGLFRWNGEGFRRTGLPAAVGSVQILSMLRDRDSNIWVGTARGLLRINANGESFSAEDEIRSHGGINALFEDREGDLWVGGSQGLGRIRDSTFISYPVGNNLSDSGGPIYVDERGRAWFAPLEGTLHWREGAKAGTIPNNSISEDVVYSIAGQKDDVWIGRRRGGLTHLVYDHNVLSIRTYTETNGLAQNSVYAVYETRDGTVWSGTVSNGLSELKDGHFMNYTTANGLASNMVSAIAEGDDGSMWFGTPNGLSELAKTGWRNYTVRDGLISPDINCLLEDSTGVLWIGTAGGLAFLRNGRIQTPQGTQDWLREPILGMAEDTKGELWVSTGSHMLRANRSSLISGQPLNDADFRLYSLDDGLRGTEGVKRFRSVVSDSQGSIWFSTNRGLSTVNPSLGAANTPLASLHIVGVKVDGTEARLGHPVQIPPGTRKIVIDYVGLSLANPARIRYRYRLDGFDRGWGEVVSNREALFANLSPGNYRFAVICSNSDGIWNTDGASIDISVLPFYYETTWFRLLCLAGLVALLWGVYQLRLRQLARQFKLALDARVDERTRIARELHDTLLQSFQGLTLHFQRARNLLPGRALEAIQALDTALDGAEQAIVEGRDAIHDLRSPATAPRTLEEEIKALGKELVTRDIKEQERIDFRIVVEGSARALSSNLHIDIFRIVREALRNAFNHSHGHRIETEMAYTESLFRVRIRDDGKGIGHDERLQAERSGHWGLRGMRERAEHLGGKLEVWSEPGAGTEIELKIPASIAYETPPSQDGFWLFWKRGRRP